MRVGPGRQFAARGRLFICRCKPGRGVLGHVMDVSPNVVFMVACRGCYFDLLLSFSPPVTPARALLRER